MTDRLRIAAYGFLTVALMTLFLLTANSILAGAAACYTREITCG